MARVLSMVALIAAFAAAEAQAQSAAAAPPEFDVASVRPADPQINAIEKRVPTLHADQGRLTFNNIFLADLVMLAYGVGKGQLSWPDTLTEPLRNRYDVRAKLPPDTTKEQIPLMLQGLLAERFKLKLHHEIEWCQCTPSK